MVGNNTTDRDRDIRRYDVRHAGQDTATRGPKSTKKAGTDEFVETYLIPSPREATTHKREGVERSFIVPGCVAESGMCENSACCVVA
eukprot:8661855-Pyramimonas_sp.AAC.1